MDDQSKDKCFHYRYSSKQYDDIRRIREKYLPKETDKLEQLRRLDRSVTEKGLTVALTDGISGMLLLGIGMCCTMLWEGPLLIPGTVVGTVGIALMIAAYPAYTAMVAKQRKKIAPEILRLADELIK